MLTSGVTLGLLSQVSVTCRMRTGEAPSPGHLSVIYNTLVLPG